MQSNTHYTIDITTINANWILSASNCQSFGAGIASAISSFNEENEMKWNESGFRPPLCTYRLNWARRTSWKWWDDWDDTVLQTQYSKFEPWRSEAEHAASRSRRLPTILTFTRGWGRNVFVSFKPPRLGTEPRTPAWKAAVLTTTLGPPPQITKNITIFENQLYSAIKHLLKGWHNVVTPSATLTQHFINIGWMSSICWDREWDDDMKCILIT